MSEPAQETEADVLASLTADMAKGDDDAPETTAQSQEAPATEETKESPDDQPDDPTEEAPEAGTESEKDKETGKNQAREEKEAARKEKTWKQLNEEKEQIRKEREEVQRLRTEAEQIRAEKAKELVKSPQPLRDERGATADEYEDYARRWEEQNHAALKEKGEVDVDLKVIANARALAQGLRIKESQMMQEAQQEVVRAVLNENPDLKNIGSPLAIALRETLETAAKSHNNPYATPDGLIMAVHHAKLRVKADSVPALEEKINKLVAENQRLTKLSTPSKGGVARAGSVPASDSKEALMRDLEAAMAGA